MICSRCNALMYPKGRGARENHPRGYCSDGAPVHMTPIKHKKTKGDERPPPFPQPAGIFTEGTLFDPLTLLRQIRPLYERLIIGGDPEGDLDIEAQAFLKLLRDRIEFPENQDTPVFRLYSTLQLKEHYMDQLIFEYNGVRYLRLPCLQYD